MPNLEERLQAVVSQSETDSSKWHTIVHGDDTTTVPTENGNVPSVAKQLKDVRAEIINGLEDYVGDCRQAKADTLQIKSETQIIKNETNTLKGKQKLLEMKRKHLRICRKQHTTVLLVQRPPQYHRFSRKELFRLHLPQPKQKEL